VAEHSHAREGHSEAKLVGRLDHFAVAHRAARLDDRRGARFRRLDQAVGEREEGFRGAGAALQVEAKVSGPKGRDPGAILAVHLAGSDAQGLAVRA
jgi:hypothetical protein